MPYVASISSHDGNGVVVLAGRLAYAVDARVVYASEVTIVLFEIRELRLNRCHVPVSILGQREARFGIDSPIEV